MNTQTQTQPETQTQTQPETQTADRYEATLKTAETAGESAVDRMTDEQRAHARARKIKAAEAQERECVREEYAHILKAIEADAKAAVKRAHRNGIRRGLAKIGL